MFTKLFQTQFLLQLILWLCPFWVAAQSGTISGQVLEGEGGAGLPGASVVIDGTTQGSITDLDGKFNITAVKPGTYQVKISYVGFETETIENVIVKNGENKTLKILLRQNAKLLSGAEVLANKSTHTENAVLMEVKQSEQVVNGISSQQIAKSQDRTAAEVIRRIPGVTLMENGFVNIRGLSERYNSTLLNGVFAPGMDPDKKAFALDLVPGSLLDRLMVYKTGAPELPGEFAGGIIKVFTKNVTDETQLSVNYTSGIRMNTTFRDFYQAPKGNTDWLGKDDGTRNLPSAFPSNLYNVHSSSQLAQIGRQLPNAWTAAKISAGPDHKFGASLTSQVKFGKVRASNITSIQYGMTHESLDARNLNFNYFDVKTQRSDTIYEYKDMMFTEGVRISMIHNWSFFVSPKSKIEFRNFVNQQGSNQAIIRSGANYEEGDYVKSYAFRYKERTLYSGQLSGSHDVYADKSKIDWSLGYSYTHSAEPDFRRIRTKKSLSDTKDSTGYAVYINSSASTLDAGRFYSDLNENTGTFALNFEHSLKPRTEKLIPKLRAGLYSEAKQRTFDGRWMSYVRSNIVLFDPGLLMLPLDQIFAPENINDSTGFKLEEGTNPSDSYDADNLLFAGYAGLCWPLSEKVNVSGGVRYEYNRQQLDSRTYTNRIISIDNPVSSILPSVNLAYNFNPKMLVRFAYARSVNRPEFRELAPFAYYDFTFNNILTGNSELKTAKIDNLDARWEFYPTGKELVTVGVFYKYFTNPIEMFYVPGGGGGGTRSFTFGNAARATSLGAEIEVKKFLFQASESNPEIKLSFTKKILSRTGITMNGAVINSQVDLGSRAVGQSEKRPMMGQSPYIINAGIFYSDFNHKFQINALYNIIGKRIFAVGTDGTPDIYYMPRHAVDLTISKGIGNHLEIKAGVQDLLAENEVYRQDSNQNGKIDGPDENVFVIRRGAYYNLGFSYKF